MGSVRDDIYIVHIYIYIYLSVYVYERPCTLAPLCFIADISGFYLGISILSNCYFYENWRITSLS